MLTLGVLSGTSVDAIDVALVDWQPSQPKLIAYEAYPWPEQLATQLLNLPEQQHVDLSTFGKLHSACGLAFSDAINRFITHIDIEKTTIRAVGSHGQTVWHAPQGATPFSLQIGHPAIIAKTTGIAVAADFRMDDIALGGQGAPLAPAFHRELFAQQKNTIGMLNLGGMANLTVITPTHTFGFDTGPANTLLDAWYRHHHNHTGYDHNGTWAASARYDTELLDLLLAHPYFSQTAPKSTGREDFSLDWLIAQLNKLPASLSPAIVQSTLLQFSVESIALAVLDHIKAGTIWLCGGGTYNLEFTNRLMQRLPSHQLLATEQAGYAASTIEAMLFAWLAKQRVLTQLVDLTDITGASRPAILGGLWLP
ncbi:MAG: anhydro-N-acetylmuramic acid kinase [Proteobacteria bacterium]|nr:anhydro-N-acetylmuramic acid kinase [Pseudomonadota bacterium]